MKSIRKALTLAACLTATAAFAQSPGFRINDSTLADPAGQAFRIRGVNHVHWDQPGGITGIPLSGANAERMGFDFRRPAASNAAMAMQMSRAGVVPIVGHWGATGRQDAAALAAVVDDWVAQADSWRQLNAVGIVNIANEWGPAAQTNTRIDNQGHWAMVPNGLWKAGYLAAIPRMRAAGYTGTLMVDAGYNGQDWKTITLDGRALLDADPLHNIVFSLHVYAGPGKVFTTLAGLNAVLDELKATRLPIVIGEFGPGNSIGPSPTALSPLAAIRAFEKHGFGWLAWAWDDNDLPGCNADDLWFAMVTHCGVYTGKQDELTLFGQQLVPLLQVLADPAGGF